MASALCLYEDNRIHSAWKVLPNGNYDGMPIVEKLPEGNLPDYQYIDGEFIYNPLPKEEPAEPTPSLEDRVSVLEETVNTTLLQDKAKISEYEESLQELGVEV